MSSGRDLSPEAAVRVLEEYRFPEIFTQILRGQHLEYCEGVFSIYFEQPSEFYRLLRESPDDIPYASTIVPLRESNYDFFVCFVPNLGIFLEHSIEWKPEDHRVVANSLTEYLDYEVDRLCDFGVEPDELRCFGALIGHADIERIAAEYEGPE